MNKKMVIALTLAWFFSFWLGGVYFLVIGIIDNQLGLIGSAIPILLVSTGLYIFALDRCARK